MAHAHSRAKPDISRAPRPRVAKESNGPAGLYRAPGPEPPAKRAGLGTTPRFAGQETTHDFDRAGSDEIHFRRDGAFENEHVATSELQVLRGMGELLRQLPLQSAIIESSGTELYAGQALQAEVVRFMSAAGFRCVKDCACEFHCDAVFIPSIVSSADGQSTQTLAKEDEASRMPCMTDSGVP